MGYASETPNEGPLEGAEADAFLDQVRERNRQRYEEMRKEALAAGKEPFDLDVFYETYLMATPFPDGPREKAAASWEQRYFRTPSYMTVKAFAEGMNQSDVYDGGDMHIE